MKAVRKRACCCGCPTLIVVGLVAAILVLRHVPAWPPGGVTKLASSEGCKRPDWSPDGESILFDRWPSGGVGYIDLDDGEVHMVAEQGFEPCWFADGRRVLVMQAARYRPGTTATYAAIYTTDGEKLSALDEDDITFWHGHPDRSSGRIYGVTAPSSRVAGRGGPCVVVLDPDDGGVEVITSADISHPSRGVTWSPDGRQSAYRTVRRSGAHYHHVIEVANLDGTEARVLRGPKTLLSDPAWSPDEEWLAVVAVRPSSARRLTEWADGVLGGSRAGLRLADAITKAAGDAPHTLCDLWLIRADGGKPRRIIAMGGTDDAYSAALATNPPAWSPDGGRIAIVKDGAIWVADVPPDD